MKGGVSHTFSKYLISYSRMMPLGRSGSFHDSAMLSLAALPFFTTLTRDGAARGWWGGGAVVILLVTHATDRCLTVQSLTEAPQRESNNTTGSGLLS